VNNSSFLTGENPELPNLNLFDNELLYGDTIDSENPIDRSPNIS
jgi:hypothetical protein